MGDRWLVNYGAARKNMNDWVNGDRFGSTTFVCLLAAVDWVSRLNGMNTERCVAGAWCCVGGSASLSSLTMSLDRVNSSLLVVVLFYCGALVRFGLSSRRFLRNLLPTTIIGHFADKPVRWQLTRWTQLSTLLRSCRLVSESSSQRNFHVVASGISTTWTPSKCMPPPI